MKLSSQTPERIAPASAADTDDISELSPSTFTQESPATITSPGGKRLDVLITEAIPSISRSEAQRWIESGSVLVNGSAARSSDRPKPGELIIVWVPTPTPTHLVPESIPLNIVYEDSDLVVIDKSAGITVHPGAGIHTGTLVHALLAHCGTLSVIGGQQRPGIVHRLDRDTSGLIVAAKNDVAHRSLAEQISSKTAGRQYLAISWGNPPWNEATVRAAIGRDPKHRTRMAAVAEEDGGRPAETLLDVQERLPLGCILRAALTTGRTHQVRVHCALAGVPIVGDPVYGDHRARCQKISDPVIREALLQTKRQALHACYLSFIHPRTGELKEFCSIPPDDWLCIERWMRAAHPVSISSRPR